MIVSIVKNNEVVDCLSFDERLAAYQVLQILVSLLVFLLFLDRLGHYVSKFCSIEEGTCVLKYVLRPVIQNFPYEKRHQSHQLGMLAEVKLILYAKLQL